MSTTTTTYKFIKPELTDTADITATNPNWDKVESELKALHNANTNVFEATSTDGVIYDVNGDVYRGHFTIIPNMDSASSDITLRSNGNELHPLVIRDTSGKLHELPSNFRFKMYEKLHLSSTEGTQLIVNDISLPLVDNLEGIVPIKNGGTEANNVHDARINLGITENITTLEGGQPYGNTFYTFRANVEGLTKIDIGYEVTVIPHLTTYPTYFKDVDDERKITGVYLNINELFDNSGKRIKLFGYKDIEDGDYCEAATIIKQGVPLKLRYDGTCWVAVEFKLNASQSEAGLMSAEDKVKLDGIVEATREKSGLMSAEDKVKLDNMNYTYGTEDLTAGTSQLETGKLYFVYE